MAIYIAKLTYFGWIVFNRSTGRIHSAIGKGYAAKVEAERLSRHLNSSVQYTKVS